MDKWVSNGRRTVLGEMQPVFNRLDDISSHDRADHYIKHGCTRLSMDEVRAIYDALDEDDRQAVAELAFHFVWLAKDDEELDDYNFDDALVDVARLGVFICA
jgi:DNA-binding GntR family transcriptional regulator